jgi:hypothetical protein
MDEADGTAPRRECRCGSRIVSVDSVGEIISVPDIERTVCALEDVHERHTDDDLIVRGFMSGGRKVSRAACNERGREVGMTRDEALRLACPEIIEWLRSLRAPSDFARFARESNGGGGGSRTRVREYVPVGLYMRVRFCCLGPA